MKRTRTLIVIGCACVAMMMSTTAFAMPGATSLVTVEPKTAASQDQNINETAQSTETAQTVSLEAMGQAAAAAGQNVAQAAQTAQEAQAAETSPYENVAVSTVNGDEDYVNIRDAAGTAGVVVGKIYNHCAATIEETVEAEDGTWYKIHSGSVEGYIKAEYFVTGDEAEALALEIGQMFGYVEEGGLRVRTEPNTTSDVITKLWSGETYTVLEQADGFVKLSLGDDDNGNAVTGYVAEQYMDVYIKFDKAVSLEEEKAQEEAAKEREEEAAAAANSSERDAIVAYAKQFIGNPYVWGGSSLTNGTDCSGFTRGVLGHFGYGLSRTSRAQAGDGRQVSLGSVQPGDLIFYASGGSIYHVALYIGGGRVIHAIDEAHGIGISSMYCMTPYCAVNVID